MRNKFYIGVFTKKDIKSLRNMTKEEVLLFLENDSLQHICEIYIGEYYIWDEKIASVHSLGKPLFRNSELLKGIPGKSFPYVLEKESHDKVKELFHVDFSLDDEQETLLFWCI